MHNKLGADDQVFHLHHKMDGTHEAVCFFLMQHHMRLPLFYILQQCTCIGFRCQFTKYCHPPLRPMWYTIFLWKSGWDHPVKKIGS